MSKDFMPKGLAFVRGAIANALTGNSKDAVLFAESRWGSGSRAALVTKAAVPGLHSTVDGGSQIISSEGAAARAEFFDLVRASAIIGKLPVQRIPFRTATLVQDEGPRVEWKDEGAAYSQSPIKLTRVTGLEPFDVGAMIVASNEVLRDAALDAELWLRDQLVKALAVAVDAAFIDPANSGTSDVKPASVTNGTGTAGDFAFGVVLRIRGDQFTGDPLNAWIILNPWTAARLSGAARPNVGARGGSLAGFPVITSTAVNPEDIIVLDPACIAVAMGNADLRVSQQASVQMDSAPSMTSTTDGSGVTAVSQVSMWQTNSTAFIGSINANWRLTRDNAVQVFNAPQYGLAS